MLRGHPSAWLRGQRSSRLEVLEGSYVDACPSSPLTFSPALAGPCHSGLSRLGSAVPDLQMGCNPELQIWDCRSEPAGPRMTRSPPLPRHMVVVTTTTLGDIHHHHMSSTYRTKAEMKQRNFPPLANATSIAVIAAYSKMILAHLLKRPSSSCKSSWLSHISTQPVDYTENIIRDAGLLFRLNGER